MDDPGQWKCVLDKLVPSEMLKVMLALPETRSLAPVLKNMVVNAGLIKHGLNEHVVLLPLGHIHALAWRNYAVLQRYLEKALDGQEPAAVQEALKRILLDAIRYGDARSLELIADAIGDVEIPLTWELRQEVQLGEAANVSKLTVLRDRFGYQPELSQPRRGVVRNQGEHLPPPVLRLFNNYRLDEMVATLLNPEVEDWLRYEYALAIVKSGQPFSRELIQGMERDPKARALIETALIAKNRDT